ncbi:hypothetical protein DITRI_Ditri03aG0044400 [Diplodiscus trichospermus]
MKIFSWVQNKLTSKKSNSIPANNHILQPCKEEFSDWPLGLLAIGTFGNKIKQETEKANLEEKFSTGHDHLHGLTPEQAGKLPKELNLIYQEHVGPTSANLEATNLPFDKFLDTNSSTEADDRNCSACSDDSNNKNDHDLQYCSTSLVDCRAKDICLDNSKGRIGKESLSFLLKKMVVCRSGFSPSPSLRDPTMESQMQQMLRTILRKKIYPQSSSPKLSTKKSLESSHIPMTANGNGKGEKADDGSYKWVKTDSEYIISLLGC